MNYFETIRCLIDGARGIYVPMSFATCYDHRVWHISEDDYAILSTGPDQEYYWETWDDVLNYAHYEEGKHTWRLYLGESGDLFCVRDDHEFEEDTI
jgi:hypothetical protein